MSSMFRLKLVALGGLTLCLIALGAAAFLTQPASADVGPCPVFPSNNVWNTRVDNLPVDSHSTAYINAIGATTGVHPDFGSGTWDGGPIGIPYTTVPGSQPLVQINYQA